MFVRYKIQADEVFFTSAFQRHYKQHALSRFFSTIRAMGIIVFTLCAMTAAVQKYWLPAFVTLGLALLILLSRKLDHFWLLWNLKKSPFWDEETVMEISDVGLKTSSNKGNADLAWQAFTRALRFPDGFLLYQGPSVFYWLPDSTLAEGFNAQDTEAVLRKHIANFRVINNS